MLRLLNAACHTTVQMIHLLTCLWSATINWLSAGSLPVKCIINRRATIWMTRVLLEFDNIHIRLCVQSWWGWNEDSFALVAYWLDLSCGQPACSLCSSNVHSSPRVQSRCANCTHVCLRVCCSTSKDFFDCCQAIHWGTSLTLLSTPAGASVHPRSSPLLPPSKFSVL